MVCLHQTELGSAIAWCGQSVAGECVQLLEAYANCMQAGLELTTGLTPLHAWEQVQQQ
jgi:hypothetical protein